MLKKGDNMKFIDNFFTLIYNIQIGLEKFEEWYKSKQKYISWVYILTFIIGVTFILCKQLILGEIIVISGMVISGLDKIIGWKHSVRKWLKMCALYNFFFSAMLAATIQDMIGYTVIDTAFVVIYLLVWVFLSLISYSKVSMLVNEIVSGVTTTIFTIGTYLVSITLKNSPASKDYILYFHTDKAFGLAIEKGDPLALKFVEIICLEELEIIFKAFLPVIGVTALSIIFVKIKVYWLEKNKISEPQKEIENAETSNAY